MLITDGEYRVDLQSDAQAICKKFQELAVLGIITNKRVADEVKSPDPVTRLLRWGDKLKEMWPGMALWHPWLGLERLEGCVLTTLSGYGVAAGFLGQVRGDREVAKYVLEMFKMATQSPDLIQESTKDEIVSSLKTTQANVKSVINTLALTHQIVN